MESGSGLATSHPWIKDDPWMGHAKFVKVKVADDMQSKRDLPRDVLYHSIRVALPHHLRNLAHIDGDLLTAEPPVRLPDPAGVPAAAANSLAHLPPTAVMFAALLGYNPIQMLLGSTLTKLPPSHAAYLTGHSFFPSLISAPFHAGLDIAFDFAIVACLIAAVASLLRGKRYIHELDSESARRGLGRRRERRTECRRAGRGRPGRRPARGG